MSHQSQRVQNGAAKALAIIGDVRAVQPLLEKVAADPRNDTFISAISSFGDEVVRPLIEMTNSDQQEKRAAGVKALGFTRRFSAVAPLKELLDARLVITRDETITITKALIQESEKVCTAANDVLLNCGKYDYEKRLVTDCELHRKAEKLIDFETWWQLRGIARSLAFLASEGLRTK